jgi:hypothetical protein
MIGMIACCTQTMEDTKARGQVLPVLAPEILSTRAGALSADKIVHSRQSSPWSP